MVDEHSVGDLTISVGDKVVAHGRLGSSQVPGEMLLWVLNPWETSRVQRVEGGYVAVALGNPGSLPTDTVVRVTGIWNGSSIVDAEMKLTSAPRVECTPGSSSSMSPGEAGESVFMSALQTVISATSHLLASGGSTTAAWAYVLYMTPQITKAQESSSVRMDIFSAIAPFGE